MIAACSVVGVVVMIVVVVMIEMVVVTECSTVITSGTDRLDDQELTMETRRQSEKQLQKAREKERAQATRISDEEKRNSAITNAMKHWKVVKKEHRKLVRKPSESSTSESQESFLLTISLTRPPLVCPLICLLPYFHTIPDASITPLITFH